MRPGNILTSVLKNTNVPVVAISEAYKNGKLASLSSILSYNLDSGATGITDLATISTKIKASGAAKWDEIKAKVAAVSDKIKSGAIKVTNAQAGAKFDPKNVSNITYSTEKGFLGK
jgi:basic membrane protein A